MATDSFAVSVSCLVNEIFYYCILVVQLSQSTRNNGLFKWALSQATVRVSYLVPYSWLVTYL